MWKLAISQLKSHPRRYVAVLLAITLGTMFLAGSLLVTSSAKETTKQMLGATYANADLLITAEQDAYLDPESAFYDQVGWLEHPGDLETISGVAEVYPLLQVGTGLVLPEDSARRGSFDADADFLLATNTPDDTSLLSTPITAGTLPRGDTEIAVDTTAAERHELTVGDTVTLRGLIEDDETEFTVSGIVDTSGDPTAIGAMAAYLTPSALAAFTGDDPIYTMGLVRVDGDLDAVLQQITTALSGVATVNTPEVQISESLINKLGFDAITVVLGSFAAIALLVMMLVINNTFSVLVAQRTRQYALQRVLGATRAQIRKSVLAETLLIGIIGSVIGIVAAIGLIFGLIILAQRWVARATFAIDATLLWVLLAGVLITVVAAWAPASKAMRVSPLAAMRPVPAVTVGSQAGIVRLVLGALALIGGTAVMLLFAFHGDIGMAILGGAISFLGALLLGVLFVPAVVYGLGWALRPIGVPGKMAQLNSVRNRSRTAATATALIIGTTLVAMILTGGRTVQENTDQLLATSFPVDVYAELSDIDPADSQRLEETTRAVATTPGVAAAVPLTPVATTVDQGEHVMAGDPKRIAQISAALTEQDAAALADPGTVLVSNRYDYETLTAQTSQGPVELDAVQSELSSVTAIVSTATAAAWDAEPLGPAVAWIAVDDPEMSATDMQDLITSMASNAEVSAGNFESPLIIRATYQQIIGTVMLTVVGLLAISVLIAFVGVANTLALSALERTRENSLLRALGLTKRGLRAMLSWEAVLICAVGAILGCALGMFYGWVGSVAIFTPILEDQADTLAVSLPWAAIIGIIGTAVLAGLIASVAPSHRAAKLSPVEGLATA
ncbi:ABC transporter permease [Enteractinococcus coprophilus]|uniref:Putative ABC transport system permease protein n=1 Tax=Enteractinococcus coprophilus TaxID=1027633 RepID=A0A543ANB4_9MICC|nr:FtsX-like permease family protein [Enteractinococcus coprophilus]TQL74074.1 putative ABC transport system permease protein [Enteractinococcus coprophilus]